MNQKKGNQEGNINNSNLHEANSESWDIPLPSQAPSKGQSLNGAQLNVQKLMNVLGMPTMTMMLIKLKGDPELAKSLCSFLNDELVD